MRGMEGMEETMAQRVERGGDKTASSLGTALISKYIDLTKLSFSSCMTLCSSSSSTFDLKGFAIARAMMTEIPKPKKMNMHHKCKGFD
jgi:hypothetical protein